MSLPADRRPGEVHQRSQAALAPVALVDLLDRLLSQGVVLSGDLVISLAGVDLVEVHLHALITSVKSEMRQDQSETRREGE